MVVVKMAKPLPSRERMEKAHERVREELARRHADELAKKRAEKKQ